MKEFDGFGGGKPSWEETVAFNIVEVFEGLLQRYGIVIPDSNRDDNKVSLVGINYDETFGNVLELVEEGQKKVRDEYEEVLEEYEKDTVQLPK